MKGPRRITVIFNPNAGVGRFKVDEAKLISRIDGMAKRTDAWIDLEYRETSSKGDCYDLTREAVGAGSDVVAVAGGDGTIMEAVNALMGTDVCLGIIPIGSGNDTIVSIAGHNGMDRCMEDILAGNRNRVDVGVMNDDHFLNVVGLGLDAEVNHYVARRRELVRKLGPALTYAYAAVKVLLDFEPYEVHLELDGKDMGTRSISLCTIGNGTTCGGGYRLTPKAVMTDGLMDLSVSGYIGKARSILSIGKAYKGLHLEMKSNEYATFEKALIESANGRELPYHMDGEGGHSSSIEFGVVPGGICTVHRPLRYQAL